MLSMTRIPKFSLNFQRVVLATFLETAIVLAIPLTDITFLIIYDTNYVSIQNISAIVFGVVILVSAIGNTMVLGGIRSGREAAEASLLRAMAVGVVISLTAIAVIATARGWIVSVANIPISQHLEAKIYLLIASLSLFFLCIRKTFSLFATMTDNGHLVAHSAIVLTVSHLLGCIVCYLLFRHSSSVVYVAAIAFSTVLSTAAGCAYLLSYVAKFREGILLALREFLTAENFQKIASVITRSVFASAEGLVTQLIQFVVASVLLAHAPDVYFIRVVLWGYLVITLAWSKAWSTYGVFKLSFHLGKSGRQIVRRRIRRSAEKWSFRSVLLSIILVQLGLPLLALIYGIDDLLLATVVLAAMAVPELFRSINTIALGILRLYNSIVFSTVAQVTIGCGIAAAILTVGTVSTTGATIASAVLLMLVLDEGLRLLVNTQLVNRLGV